MSVDTQKFINTLLADFRHLVVEIEDENRELKAKLRQLHSAQISTSTISSSSPPPPSSSTDSSSYSAIAATAAALARKLSNRRNNNRQTSPSWASTQLVATTNSSTNSNNTLPPSSRTRTSPFNELSSNTNTTNTLSSGTLSTIATATTGSTKPPPYKSVVGDNAPNAKNNPNNKHLTLELAPQVPLRRKRRQTILDRINNRMTAQRGALIVLEGLDRVGKSTLAKKLVEHLERVKTAVTYQRFPNRSTPVGQLIDDLLRNKSKPVDDHAMHLLFSANRWELNKEIKQTLLQGTTVILDRYSYSGIAYSSAKPDIDLKWCQDVENGLLKPDLIIYLELAKESQYKRQGFGDERFEVKEFQELIRHQYNKLIETDSINWLRIDVENKGPEQVLGEVILPVKRCLETCSSKPLEGLKFD